jgi:hypothetical protein
MQQALGPFSSDLVKFLFSAVLGGIVGAALKIGTIEIGYFRNRSHLAQEKLRLYAKPLWRVCDDLKFRLEIILTGLQSKNPEKIKDTLEPLKFDPDTAQSIRWFNEHGQYVTSTAYMISLLSAWITLFERDVVFLRFKKVSSTTNFFSLLEDLKSALTDNGSILYYDYFAGIGDKLLLENHNRPMSIAAFSYSLFQDNEFRNYYNQLFKFLREISNGRSTENVESSIFALQTLANFLIENGAIPELGRKSK